MAQYLGELRSTLRTYKLATLLDVTQVLLGNPELLGEIDLSISAAWRIASISPPNVNSPTRFSKNCIASLFFLVLMGVHLYNFHDFYFSSRNNVDRTPSFV